MPNTETIEINAPASKSLSHRAIIGAALADGKSQIEGLLECDDTMRTMDVFKNCGVQIKKNVDTSYSFKGLNGPPTADKGQNTKPIPLLLDKKGSGLRAINCFVGESGTSCRLLTAIMAAAHGDFYFHGEGRMHLRPMQELTSILEALGTKFSFLEKDAFLPLIIHASGLEQKNSEILVPCQESSQYISGLLLAAALTKKGLCLSLDLSSSVSRPYVLLTLETMEQFKIPFELEVLKKSGWEKTAWRQAFDSKQILSPAEKNQGNLRIRVAPASYKAGIFKVEGDYSGASYLLAAGALGEKAVKIRGLKENSLQGDSAILDIIKAMGGKISWQDGAVTVYPSALKGVELDMGDCPDLVPTVAVLASRASSPTKIINVAHLKLKESDRMQAPAKELKKLGCHIESFEDSLIIHPLKNSLTKSENKGQAEQIMLSSHADHRIAMSLALMELDKNLNLRLDNPSCVSKSYPAFWEDWAKICPHTKIGVK